jgi:ADP-ribose pyrophosphatase YjhB (NUDIX family)
MLVLCCGDVVVIAFDPNKPRRGWTFPSARFFDDGDGLEAAITAAKEKIGFDPSQKEVQFVKAKTKKGVFYSSFYAELAPDELEQIQDTGPRGHTIRKIPKDALPDYLDRGRYDMAAARITGVSTL